MLAKALALALAERTQLALSSRQLSFERLDLSHRHLSFSCKGSRLVVLLLKAFLILVSAFGLRSKLFDSLRELVFLPGKCNC